MTKWTSIKNQGEEWGNHQKLGKGGQGVTYKVNNRRDGAAACMKVLSRQDDHERRARFFREASAYDTCQHPGVPKLVESNAHEHSDLGFKLYIATEFIVGPTLENRINDCGVLSLSDAALLTLRLLDVVHYLHTEKWVHRDIKPDNIILKDDDPTNPVLLDFGLSYKEGITPNFLTDPNQEIGNRFLRLPELMIGSEEKQDVRSDLAWWAAFCFLP